MIKLSKILIIISIFLVFHFSLFIIYPAYLSYKIDCSPIINESEIGGSFKVINNSETCYYEINVYQEPNTTAYSQTLKHESIHLSQYLNNRDYDCSNRIGVFYNELESYTFQYLPNFIYNKLYA
jgi:hypothetical protein